MQHLQAETMSFQYLQYMQPLARDCHVMLKMGYRYFGYIPYVNKLADVTRFTVYIAGSRRKRLSCLVLATFIAIPFAVWAMLVCS